MDAELTWEQQAEERYAQYLLAHPLVVEPTAAEQAVAALSYQIMQLQQAVTQGQDTVTAVQQANAQLAYQVMTLQGGAA